MTGPGRDPGATPATAEALSVLKTLPPAAASAVARQRLAEDRAAGVNQLPGARSTYRWQGPVAQAGEALPLVLAPIAGDPALARRVRERLAVEVPMILARPTRGPCALASNGFSPR